MPLSSQQKEITNRNYVGMLFNLISQGVTELPQAMLQVFNDLDLGLNIDLPNEHNQTLLMAAIQKNVAAVSVRALIRHGAKLDRADSFGTTVLMYAAKNRGFDQSVFLDWIRACANIDLVDQKDRTLLMYALENGWPVAVLQAILGKGASVHRKAKSGKSVFMFAMEFNAPKEIVLAMRGKGARFDPYGAEGSVVLAYATKHALDDLVRECTEAGAGLSESFFEDSFDGAGAAPTSAVLKTHWSAHFLPQVQALVQQDRREVYVEANMPRTAADLSRKVCEWVEGRCDFFQSAEKGQFRVMMSAAIFTQSTVFLDKLVIALIDLKEDQEGIEQFHRAHGLWVASLVERCFIEDGMTHQNMTELVGFMKGSAAEQRVGFQEGFIAALEGSVAQEKACLRYVRHLYKSKCGQVAQFGARVFKRKGDQPVAQLRESCSFMAAIALLKERIAKKAPGEKSASRDTLKALLILAKMSVRSDIEAVVGHSRLELTAAIVASLQVRLAILQPQVASGPAASEGGGGSAKSKRGRPGF